jgi:hypothetical protein
MPHLPNYFSRSIGILLALAALATAQQEDIRTTVQKLIDGTVRGGTYQAALDEQQAKIMAAWKKIILGKPPVPVETPHLFLVGKVPGQSLKDVGANLEKQYDLAAKVLAMKGEDPWPGKMAVFFLNERNQFASFIRGMEQRRLEEGEVGTFSTEGEWPYVVASAPLAKLDPSLDNQAGEQLAAALMGKKTGPKVPTWILSAFGRATMMKSGTPGALTEEHRRAYQFLVKNKRTMKDLAGGGLGDDESTVLRANFLEYLAYSGRISKFVPLVEGFRPSEGVAEPTLDTALKSANINAEQLDSTWQKWVKSLK